MAGTITHSWNGTVLTITSDSGTSSADLKGDTGCRGPQGPAGVPLSGSTGSNVDLSNYYTASQVETRLAATAANLTTPAQVDQKIAVKTANFVTADQVDQKIANADLDLTGYATQTYVAEEIAKAQLAGAEVDTSNFATKTELNTAVNGINNTLTNYATKDYVVETVANVAYGGSIDLSNYATKTYVDTAVQNNKQDLSNYATQSYVNSALGSYYTKAEIDALLANLSSYPSAEEVEY